MKYIKNIMSFFGIILIFLTSSLPFSAVTTFWDQLFGGDVITFDCDSETLAIKLSGKDVLNRDQFDYIGAWAKDHNYKHICLDKTTKLELNTAKTLANVFLIANFEDFFSKINFTFDYDPFFTQKQYITVEDVLLHIGTKYNLNTLLLLTSQKPYIILPADKLLSNIIITSSLFRPKNFNLKFICFRYYCVCDMHTIENYTSTI